MDRAKQFRQIAAEENRDRSRTGWRYSERLKALAVSHIREARRAQRSWSSIAEELGVSTLTVSRWFAEAPEARFHPVEVVERHEPAPAEPGDLVAVLPSGLRLEGLSWPQALELARALR